MCVCVLYHEYDFNNNNNNSFFLGFLLCPFIEAYVKLPALKIYATGAQMKYYENLSYQLYDDWGVH